MYQNFNFTRIVGDSAYPGIEVEETFEGVVNLPEHEDDEPELISVKRNGVEIPNCVMRGISLRDWRKFESLCFEAARDAQWAEHCKKERA